MHLGAPHRDNRYILPSLDAAMPVAVSEEAFTKLDRDLFEGAARKLACVVRPYYSRSLSLVKACQALIRLSPRTDIAQESLERIVGAIKTAISLASHFNIPSSLFEEATLRRSSKEGASLVIETTESAFEEAFGGISVHLKKPFIPPKIAREYPALKHFSRRIDMGHREDEKRGGIVGSQLRGQMAHLAEARGARFREKYKDDWSSI
ncbi:hypothetical protein D9611_000944 [Ephemerocybe angulata]|uniref:Uncharacterized protein n=1 Tax=Ephemerocybe angulata TaxID=980116 RepID=A0A8H5F7C9_9AGAR|nr:hypothetical protein D9611_000944 [Tulosesus angulatus]